MSLSEREYIELCKRQIGEKFLFGNGNGAVRQRDLEDLADKIEETSGIKLSLSTLKRLWKDGYDQSPHPSTLQALVSVLGYRDWQEFKAQVTTAVTVPLKPHTRPFNSWVILPLILVIPVVLWLIAFRSGKPDGRKPIVKGPVIFKGNKTVASGVPSTIIFNYDLGKVEADSFFFQQAWNDMEKVRIDPQEHYYSNIYYYPGFHKAKLKANDSIVSIFRVHITTDGWLPLIRYARTDHLPVYLRNSKAVNNGSLHIDRNALLSSGVNTDRDFVLSYYNVRDFGNISSDNFSIDTRVACDSINTIACPAFDLTIICEMHIFYVRMTGKGCERNIGIKMGEVSRDGIDNDLSMFGRDLYKWQRLQINIVNKQVTIYLDDQPVYTSSFKNDFGRIMGLVYNFSGTGAVDYIKLKDGANKLVYEDEFNK